MFMFLGVRRSSPVCGEACNARYCPIAGGRQCRAHGNRRNARPGRDRQRRHLAERHVVRERNGCERRVGHGGRSGADRRDAERHDVCQDHDQQPARGDAPTAPTFTTNNYGAGSPHWVIQFADGDSLAGYPSNADLGDTNWSVVPASSGACSGLTLTHDTYVNAVAFVQNAGCGGNVTGVAIVADGNQAAGTSDTITDIVYDGETLVSGPDTVTVTNPGAETGTVGTAISVLDIAASSNKGDQIASYAATGLPAGLSVDTSTGAITGTPTTAGTYHVTISATDNGGTTGTASFTWTIRAPRGKADIAAKLSCPRSLVREGTGTCTLTVSNNGPATAGTVVAQVALLASLTETTCSTGCARHGDVISWSQPYLAAGASVQDTTTVKATGAGVALVLAVASSANPDPRPYNNFSLAIVRITR